MRPKEAHFKYWLDYGPEVGAPEPVFALWVETAKGYSDVSAATLTEHGVAVPAYPTVESWRAAVLSKIRCGRCWATTRGHTDLMRHAQVQHLSAPYFPRVAA